MFGHFFGVSPGGCSGRATRLGLPLLLPGLVGGAVGGTGDVGCPPADGRARVAGGAGFLGATLSDDPAS